MLTIVSDTLDPLSRLSKEVRDARRRRGLSQEDVALAAGVARGVVQKLETGRGLIRLDTALAILSALSLDVELRDRTNRLTHGD